VNRYLPAAWIVWSFFVALLEVIVLSPLLNAEVKVPMIAHGPSIIASVLVTLSFALVYAIFNRVVLRPLVFWLGWIHLGLQIINRGTGSILQFERMQAVATLERFDVSGWLWLSVVSGVASFLSVLCFFAVVCAALNDTRRRIELRTFD
jgi:hypothetical protein